MAEGMNITMDIIYTVLAVIDFFHKEIKEVYTSGLTISYSYAQSSSSLGLTAFFLH